MQKSAQDATQLHPPNTSADAKPNIRQFDIAIRVLRMKQVVERTNLSRATLYSLISRDPSFPRKVRLSARAIGFLEHEIDAWILARSEKGDGRTRRN